MEPERADHTWVTAKQFWGTCPDRPARRVLAYAITIGLVDYRNWISGACYRAPLDPVALGELREACRRAWESWELQRWR